MPCHFDRTGEEEVNVRPRDTKDIFKPGPREMCESCRPFGPDYCCPVCGRMLNVSQEIRPATRALFGGEGLSKEGVRRTRS